MKKGIIFTAFLCFNMLAIAQHSWVFFNSDKHTDSAVNSCFLQELDDHGISVIGTSKWFNAACVEGYDASWANQINCTDSVSPLRLKAKLTQTTIDSTEFSYGTSLRQLSMLGLDQYHEMGFTGKGVTIALFDGGFYRADSMQAFDSLRKFNRLIDYYDFVDQDTWLFDENGHGRSVLSIAGAFWQDSIMGAAPRANFVLARTEDVDSETHLEEYNWVKALEWADSIGVDIIHSSLGYSQFDTLEGDYTYWDMDGETTIITKAANMAVERGIFITNSAGNEGDDPWRYITAPCDGKGVLCVGAVNADEEIAAFSSIGPSSDGRVKPEVVAMGQGTVHINNREELRRGNGTSLSGPLIAGLVACLKEAHPMARISQIFQAVIQSADRYENPDTAYGYGIPNAVKADSLLKIFANTARTKKNSKFSIYPNPFVNEIHIDALAERIEVLDAMGKTIWTRGGVNGELGVETSSWATGLYIVRVITQDGQMSQYRMYKVH